MILRDMKQIVSSPVMDCLNLNAPVNYYRDFSLNHLRQFLMLVAVRGHNTNNRNEKDDLENELTFIISHTKQPAHKQY